MELGEPKEVIISEPAEVPDTLPEAPLPAAEPCTSEPVPA